MKKKTLIRHTLIGILCTFALAGPISASPLSDARDAGKIIELPNGYVASQGEVTYEIKALVKDLNERRREAYEKIAREYNIATEQVARESYLKRYPVD